MAVTLQQSYLLGTTPPAKPTVAPAILRRRVMTEQPQFSAEIDWSNPLAAGLLVAATPHSRFSTAPTKYITPHGVSMRGGVLSGKPVTYGVANSTVLVFDVCSGTDGGSWWSTPDVVYADTSATWPNDLGVIVESTRSYGYFGMRCRDSGGTSRLVTIDVYSGNLTAASMQKLVRVATIASDLTVRAWGNGVYGGQSTALQGYTYNLPSSSSAGPLVGLTGTTDTVTSQALILRWGRVLSDAEIASISANPYKIFRAPSTNPWVAV